MQLFDIITLVALAIFALIGIKRGFIEEIFRLLAMVGGLWGASLTYPFFFHKLAFIKISAQAKTILAFVTAYLLLMIVLLALGWILKKIVRLVLLGWLDHLLGGFVGAAKASIIIIIFLLSITMLPKSTFKKSITSSKTYALFNRIPLKISVPRTKKIPQLLQSFQESIPFKKLEKAERTLKKEATASLDKLNDRLRIK